MAAKSQLILGSSSKFRAQILRESGKEFTVMVPNIDEKAVGMEFRETNPDASLLTLQVAQAKMDALLERIGNQDVLVIACDQVVSYDGKVREKPVSEEEARAYLQSYEERPAETHSAVVVAHAQTGRRASGVDVARQYFRSIPEVVVDELIRKGDIMHCCGGFMIDDPLLEPYLDKREGDEDSIIGMPLKLVDRLIEEVTKS